MQLEVNNFYYSTKEKINSISAYVLIYSKKKTMIGTKINFAIFKWDLTITQINMKYKFNIFFLKVKFMNVKCLW